jgi:hypothetical protein
MDARNGSYFKLRVKQKNAARQLSQTALLFPHTDN